MSFESSKTAAASADWILLTPTSNALDKASLTSRFTDSRQTSASVLFIDSSIADYQQLAISAVPGTEVHVLSTTEDAVTQITNTLLGRSGISSDGCPRIKFLMLMFSSI